MTTSTSQANSVASTWTLQSYIDYNYLDSNLSGLRFTQGIVWNGDAGEWITSWQYGMARMSEDFTFLQTTGSVDLTTFDIITGIPQALADLGFDHIGDIDYYNGKLYISLDSEASDYQNGHVAVLNASDLSYSGELYELLGDPTNQHDDVASWVAVDGENGVGYGKEWQDGNTINVYNLDDWSFQGTLEMDQSLKKIQGAKVLDGMMYMAAHNDTRSVYSLNLTTGHVEKLFQLPTEDNADVEVEGIEARLNSDGLVEITVELIIQPDGDIYADDYTRVFTYTLGDGVNAPVTHTWTVTTTSDTTNANDLSLTLREAISKAADGDTITFGASLSGETITLADAELALSKNITIEGDLNGDGKSDITIDGGDLSSVIHVTSGTTTLNGLKVTHEEDSDGASIVVDDGATLVFTNGSTTDLATSGDDALTGTKGVDVIHGDAGDDIIMGLRGNDKLYGDAGNDLLIGGAGNDTMVGGSGADTYVVSESGDVVTELKSGGTDLVQASFSYTLGDNVENLILTGLGGLKGTGNDLANVLTGNAGANTLSGLDGNDTLDGGTGNDTLTGGAGNDTITGGIGADALTGGSGADRFVFALADISSSKAKTDTIFDMRGSAGDLIDLHAIDANEKKGGNQNFTFIGTDSFSGHAGELRYVKGADDSYIYGDTDGDKKIDFALHLDDAMSLKADYFAL
jgi:Ca2+-binding RTX toxin-like protein